jgi:hypothetical protein
MWNATAWNLDTTSGNKAKPKVTDKLTDEERASLKRFTDDAGITIIDNPPKKPPQK